MEQEKPESLSQEIAEDSQTTTTTEDMPYRVLIFAYRKPGISPSKFKTHYETRHVPLVKAIAGPLFPKSHVRRYVQRASGGRDSPPSNAHHPATVLIGSQSDFDYDAIAELIFKDEGAFQAFFAKVSEPEAAAKIAKDEEQFLDRTRMKVVVLGDCITTTGPQAGNGGNGGNNPSARML